MVKNKKQKASRQKIGRKTIKSPMNWKKYEKEILKYFQESFPETEISFDRKITGKYSKVERQIDILIEGEVAGYRIRIIVDCKHFSKNIDVKQVESFSSMVEDAEAHQGVLITQKGFSKAAINRAYYGNHKVELDIINFDELMKFQSITALPYSGHFSIILPAPFGWVMDLKDKINSFASVHQRGLTLKQAQRRLEWMYFDLWKTDNPDIGQLIEFQNQNILRIDSNTSFTYNSHVKRDDKLKTIIRIADVSTYPTLEVTGFVQFEKHILFIVLFTPKELLDKNLRKLQFLLKNAKPIELQFDNHGVIKQLLTEIEQTTDEHQKADMYYKIGVWYQEMDDFDNALINYKKAIECFPTHYGYLKDIISKTLSFGLIEESKKYAEIVLNIESKNPTVPRDLIKIYFIHNKPHELTDLFRNLISKTKDNEGLGNWNLHLGLLCYYMSNTVDANKYITVARQHFEKVFPIDHYVFKSIDDFLKD